MNQSIQQLQNPVNAWPVPMMESKVDGQTRKATPAEIRRAVRHGRPIPLKLTRQVKQVDIMEATK